MKRIILLALTMVSTLSLGQTNLITELTPGANPAAIAQAMGIQYREKAPGGPFYLFVVPANQNASAVQVTMALRTDVVWVEDDAQITAPENVSGSKGSTVAVINDRFRAYALNATALSQVGFTRQFTQANGRTAKVAVLDTGVDPSCLILWNKAVAKYNAVEGGLPYDIRRLTDSNGNGLRDEGVGHGTFVAGIIDQVSPLSKLIIVRVADSDGNSSAWRLVKGLSYSVSHGAEVANISMGTLGAVPALSHVAEWADAYGMTIVAAAGNNNLNTVCEPGGLSKVVAVAGVDPADRKAVFSNYDRKIEQAAPATGIRSYGPGNRMMVWSGTSFAAPFVSGAIIECLRHVNYRLASNKVRRALQDSGVDINAQNPLYESDLGLRLWIPGLWNEVRMIGPGN